MVNIDVLSNVKMPVLLMLMNQILTVVKINALKSLT